MTTRPEPDKQIAALLRGVKRVRDAHLARLHECDPDRALAWLCLDLLDVVIESMAQELQGDEDQN